MAKIKEILTPVTNVEEAAPQVSEVNAQRKEELAAIREEIAAVAAPSPAPDSPQEPRKRGRPRLDYPTPRNYERERELRKKKLAKSPEPSILSDYSGLSVVGVALLDAVCTGLLKGAPMHESERVVVDASLKAYLETLTEEDLKNAPAIALVASVALVVLPRFMEFQERRKSAGADSGVPASVFPNAAGS